MERHIRLTVITLQETRMRNKTKLAITATALATLALGAIATEASADRGWHGWRGHHGGGMMRHLMQR
jgi:Spy/CpxP family protein refolding chaperone